MNIDKIKDKKLSERLDTVSGVFVVLAAISFFIGDKIASKLNTFSTPSSTSALGDFLIIKIVAMLVMLLGLIICQFVGSFVIGGLLKLLFILLKWLKMGTLALKRFEISVYILFIVLIIFTGFFSFSMKKTYIVPAVHYNPLQIDRNLIDKPSSLSMADIFNDDKKSYDIKWNNKTYRLNFPDNVLNVQNPEGEMIIKKSLKRFSYITKVYIQEFKLFKDKPSCLAILTRLRATSHFAVLLIFDHNGKELYKELIGINCSCFNLYSSGNKETNQSLIVENHEFTKYSLKN